MNRERIRKMIKLAMYEEYDGKEDLEICKYFRRDYVGFGLLLNFVLITVAYGIILFAAGIANMEYLTAHFNEFDFRSILFGIILIYFLVLAVFSIITFTMRRLRYAKAKRNVDKYYDELGELEELYHTEDRNAGTKPGRLQR